ncbi:pyrroloquinoline quinone biosynthesis peptide chaperone PqqD [Mixta tenebrionis]|uniref:PqqA binding protein n=1 Tax=Mixta tenebrionis TaxID=2562439 RepID=A0A506V836_9GAMM|nr:MULTISPECIES: pyrroloquinoline quinone biosynthesis peptide chaperone PqqD [Mixta]QHM77285.1 Coenzyme PQQ synthesis protein D [Mixta theicola]TPW41991.1 pyrroloquinoline quinone biosynthesis peptide chaperone PqqD [Mixta tenebrionis]
MDINPSQTPQFRRGFRLQWEEAQDCHVILYPEGMARLNGSAAEILLLVDGKRTLGEIIAALNARFPGVPDLDADVIDFFGKAYEQKWIIFRD